MKNILFFALIALTLPLSAQQSTLHGTVAVFNSQFETGTRQYVANAQVEEDYGKSQATATNADGTFRLPLVGIKEQEKVFYSVKKTGYEVVNVDALQAVAGQAEPVRVFMAPEGKIAENKLTYYNINREASEKALTEKLRRLEKDIAAAKNDDGRLKALQEEYGQLQGQFDKIEETARDLAERYARTNLDDVSADYQRAFRCFQRGQLDSALLVFKAIDLETDAAAIISEQERNSDLAAEFERRDSEKNKRKRETNDALRFKAQLHQTRFEFEKVEKTYELLLKLDSSDLYNLADYANFLSDQNQMPPAIIYYQKCLALSKTDESTQAAFCNNLGIAYQHIQNFKEAENMYQQALEILEQLAQKDSIQFTPVLAASLMNMGNFYGSNQKPIQSEKMYRRSLSIYQYLAKLNPAGFESQLAAILMNLGAFYHSQPNMQAKGYEMLQQSLIIQERLSAKDALQFEPEVAKTLINMGVMHDRQNNRNEAENAYRRAIEILERLTRINPPRFKPYLATAQMNLGGFYEKDPNKQVEAERILHSSLRNFEQLSENSPAQFDPDLAMILTNLGIFYDKYQNFDEAKKMLEKSLAIYTRLTNINPEKYEPSLPTPLNILGKILTIRGNYDEAQNMFQYALNIHEQLLSTDSIHFEPLIAKTLNDYAIFYEIKNSLEDAKNMFSRALAIRQKEVLGGAYEFFEDLNGLYGSLSVLRDSFYTRHNFRLSFDIQQQLAACIDSLTHINADIIQQTVVEYGNLAWYSLMVREFPTAESSALRALALAPTQTWVNTNLALALLFQHKNEEAEKIYRRLKNDIYDKETGKKYRDVFLEDLETLRAAGVAGKQDIAQVKIWLE